LYGVGERRGRGRGGGGSLVPGCRLRARESSVSSIAMLQEGSHRTACVLAFLRFERCL